MNCRESGPGSNCVITAEAPLIPKSVMFAWRSSPYIEKILRCKNNGNKSYIFESGQRQHILNNIITAPLRNQTSSNKSYMLVLRHHVETKATATHHTSSHWGAPLRVQSQGNKSYIFALGHHFETKATTRN